MRYVIGLIGLILIASCGADINEDYYLKADGSGSYQIQADILPFMKNMMYSFESMADEKGQKKKIDSAKVERRIYRDMPETLDSVIKLDQMLQDELESNPEARAFAKQGYMFMRGGKMEKKMIYGLNFSYKTIGQLNEFNLMMQKKNAQNPSPQMSSFETNVTYSSENNSFTRVYKKVDSKKENKSTKTDEELMAKMVLDKVVYRTKVHSERKIKNAIGEGLVLKSDTLLIFEYLMKEYMEGKIKQDFQIEFE